MNSDERTPLAMAQDMVDALCVRHRISESWWHRPADEMAETDRSVERAVFADQRAMAEELAIVFDCDVELLRREVPIGDHTAAEWLLILAALAASKAHTDDEERARDLLRRAFEPGLPADPSGWSPRHVRRALALLDDQLGRDPSDVDDARAQLERFLGDARSLL